MAMVSRRYLKDCLLWTGSEEQVAFIYGGIQLIDIRNKVSRLRKTSNRTPEENEWLEALEKTLVDPMGIMNL